MTQMSRTRDFAELASLLEAQKETYRGLLALSRDQEIAFRNGGARSLMRIIARKQALIDETGRIDRLLAFYTDRWNETLDALPMQARRHVAALVADISSLLRDLVESERAMEKIIAAQRDAKIVQMRSVSDGKSAVVAYSQAGTASGRYLDREG